MKPNSISFEEIQQKAHSLGWDDVGVTSAHISEEDQQAYFDWLDKRYHADLAYMENAKRCNPQEFFPGAQTAIVFISYYRKDKLPFKSEKGLIASYARGRDYHHIHRKRLKHFIRWLEEKVGEKGVAKGFSDSAPLLEKALAAKAGLGWFGKNTLLIHRRFGTFTLLSGVLTTLEIPSPPLKTLEAMRLPRCGSCTRCMDACPTQALVAPYQLNATLCLSYHLIESKKPIPLEIQKKNPGYVFGCDICQDTCPHNFLKSKSESPEFTERNEIGDYISLSDIYTLSESPEKLFGTPLQRRGVAGLHYNLETIICEK